MPGLVSVMEERIDNLRRGKCVNSILRTWRRQLVVRTIIDWICSWQTMECSNTVLVTLVRYLNRESDCGPSSPEEDKEELIWLSLELMVVTRKQEKWSSAL